MCALSEYRLSDFTVYGSNTSLEPNPNNISCAYQSGAVEDSKELTCNKPMRVR